MDDIRLQLAQDTDRCVKCGLCLPVCPTYVLTRNEAESPRGRIALVQGMAAGALSAADAAPHVDTCLACRACEKVCPATVPYGAILDRGRALMDARQPRRRDRALARLLGAPLALRVLACLQRLAVRMPVLRRRSRWVAMPGRPAAARRLPSGPSAPALGDVAVLRGCVSAAFDTAACAAIATLLHACGYGVRWIDGCCGAVSQHGGDLDTARQRAARIGAQVTAASPVAVVHPASGCAAAVRDYAALTDNPGAHHAAARTVDLFVLLEGAGLKQLLRPVAKTPMNIALHIPCTQRNVLDGAGALPALLAAVTGLHTIPVHGHGCCGAAGGHMLAHRETAARLGDALLAPLDHAGPIDMLISTNIGCAWHLRDLLRQRRSSVRVLHPAQLLADLLAARPADGQAA